MEESLSEIQDLFAALRNIDKYPDTKPDPEPEAIDGELQFLIHCSGCHSGGGEGGNNARHGDVTGASASLINAKIQSVPRMHHLKPDNPVQAVSQEEIAAIVEFLKG